MIHYGSWVLLIVNAYDMMTANVDAGADEDKNQGETFLILFFLELLSWLLEHFRD
jgi:hypothetical protein